MVLFPCNLSSFCNFCFLDSEKLENDVDIIQVDTNLESPEDVVPEGVPGIGNTYSVAPYSSILLEAKP